MQNPGVAAVPRRGRVGAQMCLLLLIVVGLVALVPTEALGASSRTRLNLG
jgi:hypothetical protein